MADRPLNILCFGAHPDDCDLRLGCLALLYRQHGHRVRFVSLTNGDSGHYSQGGGPLARRRYAEARAAAQIADIEYDLLDIHDGELEPTVENRKTVIRIMREFKADLVLCHRENDYHPDHRAVGTLVQDAAYTVTVPNIVPLTPHLETAPVVGYGYDPFRNPTPYRATVAVDTDDIFDRKVSMIHCHASQFYEWLPYNRGCLEEVPSDEAARRSWLRERLLKRFGAIADEVRDLLIETYGAERGAQIRTAETVSISEYGRALTEEDRKRLFPFLP